MPKKLVCLGLILFVSFLTCATTKEKSDNVNYTAYVDEIVRSFAKEMKKEFGLVYIGDGGGLAYDVEEISVKFIDYRNATIEQAREIEVKATEKILKMINAHEKIRPYLREYPFVAKRARVSISFYKPDNDYYLDGSVSVVFFGRDGFCYFKAEPTKTKKHTTVDLICILREQYEEALRIVKENQEKN
jgi:hypothetical protein